METNETLHKAFKFLTVLEMLSAHCLFHKAYVLKRLIKRFANSSTTFAQRPNFAKMVCSERLKSKNSKNMCSSRSQAHHFYRETHACFPLRLCFIQSADFF